MITGNEIWVYDYDVKTKRQSSQWNNLHHDPKRRQVRSNVKAWLKVFFCFFFFDSERVTYSEFLPQGQALNKEYYLETMKRFHEAVRKKRPDAWARTPLDGSTRQYARPHITASGKELDATCSPTCVFT